MNKHHTIPYHTIVRIFIMSMTWNFVVPILDYTVQNILELYFLILLLQPCRAVMTGRYRDVSDNIGMTERASVGREDVFRPLGGEPGSDTDDGNDKDGIVSFPVVHAEGKLGMAGRLSLGKRVLGYTLLYRSVVSCAKLTTRPCQLFRSSAGFFSPGSFWSATGSSAFYLSFY